VSQGRRWVVLGVGTGVGKTYVSRTLVEGLARMGHAVAGLKPVETGVNPSDAVGTDAATLARAALHVKHPQPHPLYAFRDPVTPALAARREHVNIDLARIKGWLAEARPNEPEVAMHTVIETAGGVFSPLGDNLTNLDLAIAAGDATWLLVAADRLGTLHDVSATLRAMRATGARPDHLVLSAPAQPDESTGTNAAELRRMPGMPPIIELSRDATEPLVAALLGSNP
jgi:dethiobiotin synthetase